MLDSDDSLSQSNIFESLDVTNPLLVARKRFEQRHVVKPKPWRPSRKDKDVVNIDGKQI